MASSYQHPSPTNILNFLLSSSAEEFGLHNNRLLWELSLPQNFVVARSHHINDGSGSRLIFGSIYPCLLTDQGPQFTKVDSWGRSSGSSLNSHASYQLSQSNLGDIYRSWSCDDASHQHCLGLLSASCASQCSRAIDSRGPEISRSSSVWMARGWPRCKRETSLSLTRYGTCCCSGSWWSAHSFVLQYLLTQGILLLLLFN